MKNKQNCFGYKKKTGGQDGNHNSMSAASSSEKSLSELSDDVDIVSPSFSCITSGDAYFFT